MLCTNSTTAPQTPPNNMIPNKTNMPPCSLHMSECVSPHVSKSTQTLCLEQIVVFPPTALVNSAYWVATVGAINATK
uniref:Uncharacterized protein n=1 Tax=viral metagenome TaxID=1070528 RepID=A0A6C0CCL2_9ZZZZ